MGHQSSPLAAALALNPKHRGMGPSRPRAKPFRTPYGMPGGTPGPITVLPGTNVAGGGGMSDMGPGRYGMPGGAPGPVQIKPRVPPGMPGGTPGPIQIY